MSKPIKIKKEVLFLARVNWNLVTISPISTHYYKDLSVHEIIALYIIMIQVKENLLMTGYYIDEHNTFH